ILQRLQQPVHDWLMLILRGQLTDGTYDQLVPCWRLLTRKSVVYSFDLFAATDR
ncbi:hypothetical protein M569_00134, partial [Genlisea aurea]